MTLSLVPETFLNIVNYFWSEWLHWLCKGLFMLFFTRTELNYNPNNIALAVTSSLEL